MHVCELGSCRSAKSGGVFGFWECSLLELWLPTYTRRKMGWFWSTGCTRLGMGMQEAWAGQLAGHRANGRGVGSDWERPTRGEAMRLQTSKGGVKAEEVCTAGGACEGVSVQRKRAFEKGGMILCYRRGEEEGRREEEGCGHVGQAEKKEENKIKKRNGSWAGPGSVEKKKKNKEREE